MDYGIKGKTAVVTGSSSGLGAAIARTLAGEGVNLVLFARRGELIEALAAELSREHGIKAKAVPGDMREAEDILRLTDAADSLGGADILILNTGRPPIPLRAVLDETDPDRWENGYRVQLYAAVQVVQAIVPGMISRGWGRLVAVTSASVKQPMPHHGLSTVFRSGLTAYLKHLANEVARSGVTVNAVCPGSIATASISAYNADERARSLPVGRLGEPEELAAAAAFFASKQAGFITGASLQVDGGMFAGLC